MTCEKIIEFNCNSSIMANPRITLQEEEDHWGFLYDPDRNFSLGVNPESIFLWKLLEKKTTINDITISIKRYYTNVPVGIEKDVFQLVKGLMKIGFAVIILNHHAGG